MAAKILVVDDEQMLLRLVELALKNEDYQIITASSGPEALAKLKVERVDLIVLDVMLPGMSGIDVCQQIRSDPETSSVPVIMLSALAQVADKIEGIRAGADEYITKPVDFRELSARVTGLLHRHKQLGSILATPALPVANGDGRGLRAGRRCGPHGHRLQPRYCPAAEDRTLGVVGRRPHSDGCRRPDAQSAGAQQHARPALTCRQTR